MKHPLLPEIHGLLSSWASRPDSIADLGQIFGADRGRAEAFITSLRGGDFSWIPGIEILPEEALTPALGAYARETATVYLSLDCPEDQLIPVLLEEIGHHIDALFNKEETPGDEGTLFAATVLGEQLSGEEIASILAEDDSAFLRIGNRELAVECIVPRPAPPAPAPIPAPRNATSYPDTITSAVNYDLKNSPKSHGLVLIGNAALIGKGNSGGTTGKNYLSAAQNTGNTTLIAGTATSTILGGAGNNFLFGSAAGADNINGGTGSATIVAGNGNSTLVGGSKNNVLFAGSGNQSLYGGSNNGSTAYGNTLYGGTGRDTLTAGTGYSTLVSGSIATTASTLIAGGKASSLVAGLGNDSLYAPSGTNTLVGGTGKATLVAASGTNSLVSGSTAGKSNTLIAGSGPTTLVAGLGRDSIVGGTTSTTLLVTSQAQMNALGNDTVSLSTLPTALNVLGVASTAPLTVTDSLFAGLDNLLGVKNLPIKGDAPVTFLLGPNAEAAGVQTLAAGLTSDTLSVAGFTQNGVFLDGSAAVGRVSMVGGAGNDTLLQSSGGFDTMTGGGGGDLFIMRNTSFGSLDGGSENDTLQLYTGNVTVANAALNSVRNMEVFSLVGGNNTVGSLQGSGIVEIIGGIGSDTLSSNIVASVKAPTKKGSTQIVFVLPAGSVGTMGFQAGQNLTGSGIASGTTISAITSVPPVGNTPGTLTITLSQPTISAIAQSAPILGWIDGATLDGSASKGLTATAASSLAANQFVADSIASITAANFGVPGEQTLDQAAISALAQDPRSYIHRQGDYLTAYGQNELLVGGATPLPSIPSSSNTSSGSFNSSVNLTVNLSLPQVIDNTLVSGAYSTNTLEGGPGSNLYLINNAAGYSDTLPWIQPANSSTLQSGSTIQFGGDGVSLTDANFVQVAEGMAQKIVTRNGNNLIALGQNTAATGIQTILGGTGTDTFTTPSDYALSVYFNAIRGTGNQILTSGTGNDTLLGGRGNATIDGGDGNNSLVGGLGSNFIHSGIGNSTLDGGFGNSSLQADGGNNVFIVRNTGTRILPADTLNPQAGIFPLQGTVNTYVNFDPIQSTEVNQFAPDQPDNSPSITKSGSFASSDLSSFYSLKNFNLLSDSLGHGAVYGVGNALDNVMVSGKDYGDPNQNASLNATGALMLGMGGNNTLVANGDHASLYGFSNASYASPDLYAAAPFDTRTQEFLDGVIGVAGNNSLVANGPNSYLDGGPGYNDLLGQGSGSNTLVGIYGNDTFVQRHASDVLVTYLVKGVASGGTTSTVAGGTGTGSSTVSGGSTVAGGNNMLISSVNLNTVPDYITQATLLVTKQSPDLPNIDPAAAPNAPNGGQTDPANFISFANANPHSNTTQNFSTGIFAVTVPNSTQIVVQYGASSGQQYESDSGVTPDGYQNLLVSPLVPDPSAPTNRYATTLTWTGPADNFGGDVVGYTVKYRVSGTEGPWLTYVNGTSQDFAGTSANPALVVDNLPVTDASGNPIASYDFQVTARQLTLPTVTDPVSGVQTAAPVSLIGGNGNDVLWSFMPTDHFHSYGGQFGSNNQYNQVNAILNNDPLNPSLPGTIPTPPSYPATHTDTTLFPTYLDGKDGNNLLIGWNVGNGDGSNFTVHGITYTGLNTMVGGFGSDTFLVENGSRNNFDQIIKYGNQTPVDYTNAAPSTPAGIDPSGVSLNGGQHNLIASFISSIQLSDTTVSQGKFIDELALLSGGQFGMGNRLDNFLYDVNNSIGFNTMVGGGGRDSIASSQFGSSDVLIGGTAEGLDSISAAMRDYYGVTPSPSTGGFSPYTLGATLQSSSIYRDTDPVPSPLLNGPGKADPSQYWNVPALNGTQYDPLRNSDTLVVTGQNTINSAGVTLDGGAGADSMMGGAENDYFFVSSAITLAGASGIVGGLTDRNNTTGTVNAAAGDIVVGGGGNDTICYTGSDVYWSGAAGATTAQLGYALSNLGDVSGGQSISNIILQSGDPVARYATGNSTSVGWIYANVDGQLGSNILVGNQFGATLNGGGVGGTNGRGIGIDSLVGNGGNATYTVADTLAPSGFDTLAYNADTFVIGSNYRASTSDAKAPLNSTASAQGFTYNATNGATDLDYAAVNNFTVGDFLQLGGGATYFIGAPANGYRNNNIGGGAGPQASTTHFGLYYINGNNLPNLVADINLTGGFSLTMPDAGTGAGSLYAKVGGINVDGSSGSGTVPGNYGGGSWSSTGAPLPSNGIYNTALNYLGIGAMYNLTDVLNTPANYNFSQHVQFI